MKFSGLTGEIIRAALEVHSVLGPGLLESTYRTCLCYELKQQGLNVRTEMSLPVSYKGVAIDNGYRVDLLVEDTVIVEAKAVTALLPVHKAQLLSYLRLSGRPAGLLINFHVAMLRDGIKRVVN